MCRETSLAHPTTQHHLEQRRDREQNLWWLANYSEIDRINLWRYTTEKTFSDSSKSSDWTCTAADRYFIDNKLLPWHEDERKRLSRRLEKTSAKSNFLMSSLSSAWWGLFLVEVPRYHHHLSSSLIQISFMFFMKFTNKQFPVVVERFYDFARFLRSLAYSNEKKFVFSRPERAHAAAQRNERIFRDYIFRLPSCLSVFFSRRLFFLLSHSISSIFLERLQLGIFRLINAECRIVSSADFHLFVWGTSQLSLALHLFYSVQNEPYAYAAALESSLSVAGVWMKIHRYFSLLLLLRSQDSDWWNKLRFSARANAHEKKLKFLLVVKRRRDQGNFAHKKKVEKTKHIDDSTVLRFGVRWRGKISNWIAFSSHSNLQ